jgi:hypothetical protein
VQDDRQLTGDGNLCLAQAAALGKPHALCLERRPLGDAGEQHIGGFVEVTAQHGVAAFRDPCVSAWNKGSDSHLMILRSGVVLICQENQRYAALQDRQIWSEPNFDPTSEAQSTRMRFASGGLTGG